MMDTIYMAYYCEDGTTFAGEFDFEQEMFLGIDNEDNLPIDIIRTEFHDSKFKLFGEVISKVNYERDYRDLDKLPYEEVVKHWVQLTDIMCNIEWVQMMENFYKVDLKKFYRR